MKFLNRKAELRRFTDLMQTKDTFFAVLYGRRRLGKTSLLKRVISMEDLYFVADMREKPLQIEAFVNSISSLIPVFSSVIYPDWNSVFENLEKSLKRRMTIVLDEFPYLVCNSPELPSVLQNFIDGNKTRLTNIIICGSSQQMMYDLVMKADSPLYGRADEIVKLEQMNIYWLKEALSCSYEDAIAEYSIWGGVPRYWEIRKREKSLRDTIVKQVIDPVGVLYEEPMRLFSDDTRDAAQMASLISIIANGEQRLSKIASRINKPATSLTRPIKKLINLGYIRRELPYGESENNSKKSLYKISDRYIDFYYKFVIPEKTNIEGGYPEKVYDYIIEKKMPEYISFFWEKLCRDSLPLLFKDDFFLKARRWWGAGLDNKPMEIDLVSEAHNGETLIIGEVKWSDSVNIPSLISELNSKVRQFPYTKDKKIRKVLFLKKSPGHLPKDIIVFTPEDVVLSFN